MQQERYDIIGRLSRRYLEGFGSSGFNDNITITNTKVIHLVGTLQDIKVVQNGQTPVVEEVRNFLTQ